MYIIQNDPFNFTDNFEALFGLMGSRRLMVIIDEAHNIFRGISNGNVKAVNVYNRIMEQKDI